MRHSLYKYFDQREWAAAFLNGELRFRSLSYFRDYEDEQVRGDKNEGTSVYRPEGGLVLTNQTQGWTKAIPWSFNSTVNQEEIFVFCLSRSFTPELIQRFEAVACVEIFNVKSFYARVESVLPVGATLPGKPGRNRIGQPVEYYEEKDNCTPRWALPDIIAASKLKTFSWQNEYRLMFSFTDALGFEKSDMRLVPDSSSELPKPVEHHCYDLKAGSLHDICRLRDFESKKE